MEIYDRLAEALNQHPEGFPRTKTGVELKILMRILPPEEAELGSKLTHNMETVESISARIRIPEEELEKRLKQRRTETSDTLELRLKTAAEEMRHLPMFDYVVVNHPGEINQAVADIVAIIKAEKCRIARRELSV